MQRYQVRKGDTLGSIAKKFYADAARYPLIVAANAIPNPDSLKVGQTLVIPDLGNAARGVAAVDATPAPATPRVSNRTGDMNKERLGELHPLLATRGRAMIDVCAHHGVSLLVTQGLRTWAEQDALYAKGRTEPPLGDKYFVTKAKGGQSFHNFGLAFDIVVLDAIGKFDWDVEHPGWTVAAEAGKSVGLQWGGDWKGFRDRPHFEYSGGITLKECQQRYPGGLAAIWERVK